MKKLSSFLLCASMSIAALPVFSQSKSGLQTLKPTPQPIIVDGDLKDWGGTQNFYHEAKGLDYAFSDDGQNLYFAMRIDDRTQQAQAMRNGITLTFNPEGKKKEMYSLTFPSPNQDENGLYVMPKMDEAVTTQQLKKEDADERRNADMLKLRDIDLKGFKDVETDQISTANTYGIKTALEMDTQGALVYELAVPITMLHTSDLKDRPWMFNIKINNNTSGTKNSQQGMRPPGDAGSMGGGGMRRGGGMGGGGMRGGGRMGGMGGGQGNYNSSGGNQAKAVEIKEKVML